MKKWVCNICGNLQEEETIPDFCVGCGADTAELSQLEEPTPVNRWKCTICDRVEESEAPPVTCLGCGFSGDNSVLLSNEVIGLTEEAIKNTTETTLKAVLKELSYGLYVATAVKDGKSNGQTVNSVLQLTSKPPQIAISLTKSNLTHDYIMATGHFTLSVLADNQVDVALTFGVTSGRDEDKFADVEFLAGLNGCPIIKDSVGYLEAEILPEKTVDVGTHTLFVAKITSGRRITYAQPLTYLYYRSNKQAFNRSILSF